MALHFMVLGPSTPNLKLKSKNLCQMLFALHMNILIIFILTVWNSLIRTSQYTFPTFQTKELIKLGFTNINPVSFGQEYIINDNISIICYEPESVWNDSILHIAVNDFHILNVNDAGVNHKIKKYLPPIDLLCSSFSPGASGYPLCWDVSEEEQKQYYSKVKTGTIGIVWLVLSSGYTMRLPEKNFINPESTFLTWMSFLNSIQSIKRRKRKM
mgnify:CR=1 FL=1